MNAPRSIAVELALLFLRELEPEAAEDPERLVTTEAVLSFAAIRRADPPTWQHWRGFLDKYDKLELVEHMLGEPMTKDSDDQVSPADRLISLVLEAGIELFHDPDQHGWASILVDGHWENHAIRSPSIPALPAADPLSLYRQEPWSAGDTGSAGVVRS